MEKDDSQIVQKAPSTQGPVLCVHVAKKLDIGMGGWSWRVILSGHDGASSNLFWDRVIEIDGLLVYTQKGYFADWINQLEDLASPSFFG